MGTCPSDLSSSMFSESRALSDHHGCISIPTKQFYHLQWLIRCFSVTYIVLSKIWYHSKRGSVSGRLPWLKQIVALQALWTCNCLKKPSSGRICWRAVAELKHWGAGQRTDYLTVTLHIRTFWHCWRPAHVLRLPSDHVHPKLRRGGGRCCEAKQEGVHRRVPHILS